MPYSSNAELPASVRTNIPSDAGKTLFRRVVNSQLESGKSDAIAFASAWAALQNAGYHEKDGKWIKKELTASDVHVEGTDWKKPKKPKKAPEGEKLLSKASGAKPVYGYRPVMNAEEICDWFKSQGASSSLEPDDMHATVVYSKRPFSARVSMLAEDDMFWDDEYENFVLEGGKRSVEPLGDKGAVVLKIESEELAREWKFYRDRGASWDYPEYQPHVTLTYKGQDLDLESMEPYMGPIVFGGTRFEQIKERWDGNPPEIELANFEIMKYQVHRDAFTLPAEAMVRSIDMGLGGEYHVYELEGQGVYMPGRDHKDYLTSLGYKFDDEDDDEDGDSPSMLREAIGAIMDSVMGKAKEPAKQVMVRPLAKRRPVDEIFKVDDEKRIVWGWASVTTVNGEPVVDLHGDRISTDTMVNAADDFMFNKRNAKAMHQGKDIGFVLHSFPFTKELGEALGMTSDREGWVIAMKILDDNEWRKVKSGEFRGFSIGGTGSRTPNV